MAEKKETKKATKPRKKVVKEIDGANDSAVQETVVASSEQEVETVPQETEDPVFHDSGDVMFGNPSDYIEHPDEPETEAELEPEVEPLSETEPEPKIDETIQALSEAAEELAKSKTEFGQKLEKAESEDEAKKLINNELKKIETLKNNVKKVARKYSNSQISNSWNGIIQDW